ncbi:hypothetical protein [Paramaledivibacter caminithermalis]|jgi:uncharacterized tellurite resistance protein B-like protein|uniref:Uncharacterized protein n=1 Tax=Paramaledivibacter caminithermalis (strain DSM 15212 / CIP 107654 / DViRD3) TaxID=1121301 RepID=A0A1M6K2Z8_PARC5|nr:hypothetical protein [Paramaledivibacter caminithermalis]SHJ53333.1 hypothetical protein SAMN02745912_00237 [Paramaledivibacter caminithermalis DSM 15212]
MKHGKKRIAKIVDELVTYFFSIGATDIDINLKEEKEYYQISVKCNYSCKDQGKIDKLIKYLKCAKQEEMEEYFWELAGDSDVDTELTLVGMMTDEAEISCNDNTIEVNLIRYKI